YASKRFCNFFDSPTGKSACATFDIHLSQECLCHIHFDAFGQTDNYFTSRAHAVMVWGSPAQPAGFSERVIQPMPIIARLG
ncbi:MAG TPA: hypothetical protein VE604_03590, partial [Candidatus Polarisedimenticolia bacterium]|nr:hypothetical protein [Candidatus Polarisedimenticolia bacterium]